jgi:hypothetical protein
MPRTDGWTRDQLLLALRLYMRLPFGRLYASNPDIVALAAKIGRSSNALAMKASNFASLDPALQARGIRGLQNLGNADREIWEEFANNSESLAAEAEDAAVRFDDQRDETGDTALPEISIPTGDTEVERIVRARRVQSFFRSAVLTTYQSRCALSGLAIPELLIASHIIPWSVSVERRADPRNGICLNVMFDRAFDRGLLALDTDFRVMVSARLRDGIAEVPLPCSLDSVGGRQISIPERFPPDAAAVAYHREHVFQP